METEISYISCASNPVPTIAHWGKNNLICYGSCNAILVYDPTIGGGKITKTLCGHSNRVTSVRWLSDHSGTFETEIVSGSVDGSVIVWSWHEKCYKPTVLKAHESNVNIVDGVYRKSNKEKVVVASASMDCTIRIWTRNALADEFECTQNIDLKRGISMSLKFGFLPHTSLLVLACGMDNNVIRLYVEDENSTTENKLQLAPSAILSGHENWVRGMDFLEVDGALLLASASQDGFIRLWKATKEESLNDKVIFDENSLIRTAKADYLVVLESILTGHEGWVFSANWSPNRKSLKLISSSLDKTMIIWEQDPQTGLWLESIRVGEVGGNTLGFYGGMFGPNEKTIMAHSYHGAFHIWNYNEETLRWEPCVTLGGHFNEVVDLAWEPKGEFLMTVSTDQTTRIHAPWKKNENGIVTWHEIARPQVHGYDFSSLAILSRYKFVSSAEEKIIRAFAAPENFIGNFKRICKIEEDENVERCAPRGASVPSLGLSNKAVYGDDNFEQAKPRTEKEVYPEESYFVAVELTEPPTEETLIQNTLWPEIQKLYGHGYEVFCLASTRDGSLVASACKSTSAEHAAIIIWDTTNWKQVTKLFSHTLTVVQLSFSPDGKSLLSVSRDRRWSVFKKSTKTDEWFLEATSDKKTGVHTRIIWTGAWTHDSKYFATGSRDGKVVVWKRDPQKVADGKNVLGLYDPSTMELKGESVTALCFAPDFVSSAYLIALGLENGSIHFYKWQDSIWTRLFSLDKSIAHHLDVKRVAFRPVFGKAGYEASEDVLQLASCSSDYSVRLYDVNICTLR